MTTKPTLDWTAIESDVRKAVEREYGLADHPTFVKVNYIVERALKNPSLYPAFKKVDDRQARFRVTIVLRDHIKWPLFAKARGRRGSAIYIRPLTAL